MKHYVLVIRTRASAVLYPGDQFTINCNSHDKRAFQLTFRTSYDTTKEFSAPLPKDLWVEARGPADSIHDAAEVFGNTALEINGILALAANAYTGNLQAELVFSNDPQATEHEYFQSFIGEMPITTVPGRRINVSIANALIQAVAKHPDRKRLTRAIAQYVEALQSWRPGREISCLAHLYMGVEALTKAVIRAELRNSGQTEKELAAAWGIADSLSAREWANAFNMEVRRRLIFGGDAKALSDARLVSDGFEHGFSDFDEMRKPAHEVLIKTASYLRTAIIKTIGIDPTLEKQASSQDYSVPRGPLIVTRYFYGTLLGKADQLAAKGQYYPIVQWRTSLKNVVFNEKGIFSFTPSEKMTPVLGDGVQLRLQGWEVWDGSTIRDPQEPMPEVSHEPVKIEMDQPAARQAMLARKDLIVTGAIAGALLLVTLLGLCV
jgi:hypothetical protein